MTLAKIFCMTKNEYDLIEDFILYYGYLFGYENIIIIDNCSTNETVLEVYKKYEPLGIIIYYESDYTNGNQGIIFTKYMNQYKMECEYLIGLDTDEFLFSCESTSFHKEDIHNILNNYPPNSTLFKISSYPCSVVDTSNVSYVDFEIEKPVRQIITFSNEICIAENSSITWGCIPKYFSRSNAFLNTSNGNHFIQLSHGEQINSSLGLLHFNSTGKKRYYERAKNVVDGYKYFSTELSIQEQIDILSVQSSSFLNGNHKINSYHILTLRMFLVDLFEKYIKREPELYELKSHCNSKVNMKSFFIEEEFKNCLECKLNERKTFILSDYEKKKIIFYDDSLDNIKCIEIKGLQEKLMSLIE